jgi:hypothetical protein
LPISRGNHELAHTGKKEHAHGARENGLAPDIEQTFRSIVGERPQARRRSGAEQNGTVDHETTAPGTFA